MELGVRSVNSILTAFIYFFNHYNNIQNTLKTVENAYIVDTEFIIALDVALEKEKQG